MKEIKTYKIWEQEEYNYYALGEFIPNITCYLHDEDEKHAAILISPGGGYRFVSPTEGENVAKKFFDKGYNCFVLTYTVNQLIEEIPLKLQPLKDISRAVRFIRLNGDNFNIDIDKVYACGFSAGGHLTASLAVHHNIDSLNELGKYKDISNRPDGVILSYPVISSGIYAHKDSFIALIGNHGTEKEFEFMSLEKQVNSNTPPVFLWHTIEDTTVNVQNSLMFAMACMENNVVCELHLFPFGRHGLSIANLDWEQGKDEADYTSLQMTEAIKYELENRNNDYRYKKNDDIIDLSDVKSYDEFAVEKDKLRNEEIATRKGYPNVAKWIDLADLWLNGI